MIAKIKVATVVKKSTAGGKPYLNVKSSTGGYSNIWSENQHIWHLFVPDAELEVEYTTDGKFTTITGVVGVQKPEESGGTVIAKQQGPSSWEILFKKIDEMNEKLDWLVNERKTLNALPPLPEEKGEVDGKKIPW